MKQSIFEIKENIHLTESVMKMTLSGDTSDITAPGQFVNIKLDGFFLRRPISICDAKEGELTIIYKMVGKGTEAMGEMKAGTKLDILTGLGNGYDLTEAGEKPVLLGGGVGQRVEPVRVVGGAELHGPAFHALGYLVGNGAVHCGTVLHHVDHLVVYFRGEIACHLLLVEYVDCKIF